MSELYQRHINDMLRIKEIEKLSEQQVNTMLERLLKCVPNNGKLYKYRSIEGDAFKNAFDSLEKGYIWFSRADSLNDDSEICINYDPEKEIVRIKDYLLDNPFLVLKKVFNKIDNFHIDQISDATLRKVIDCINTETGKIDKTKAVPILLKNGSTLRQAQHLLKQVEKFVDNFLEKHQEAAESIAKDMVSINKRLQEISFVFSMTEDFDSDNMWAYYANGNKGFCIEYDLQKIRYLSLDAKRKLLCLYKIVYEDKEEYSFLEHVKCYFEDGEIYRELSSKAMMQVLTKKRSWEPEKEWRFYLCNLDSSNFPLDIVSSVIIDERAIKTKNYKNLVELCKERGWMIIIRKTNVLNTNHIYEKVQS